MKTSLVIPVLLVGCATSSPDSDDGFRGGSKADDASGWSHVVLESANGVGVSVDYVSHFLESHSYKPTHVDYADPVFANVWGDQLTGDESVRVVLMNYEYCDDRTAPYTYVVDLAWYGDHFSANVARDASVQRGWITFEPGTQRFNTRFSGYVGNFPFCQELAVVVDGEWQVDPISHTNNFKLDMFAAR